MKNVMYILCWIDLWDSDSDHFKKNYSMTREEAFHGSCTVVVALGLEAASAPEPDKDLQDPKVTFSNHPHTHSNSVRGKTNSLFQLVIV